MNPLKVYCGAHTNRYEENPRPSGQIAVLTRELDRDGWPKRMGTEALVGKELDRRNPDDRFFRAFALRAGRKGTELELIEKTTS